VRLDSESTLRPPRPSLGILLPTARTWPLTSMRSPTWTISFVLRTTSCRDLVKPAGSVERLHESFLWVTNLVSGRAPILFATVGRSTPQIAKASAVRGSCSRDS